MNKMFQRVVSLLILLGLAGGVLTWRMVLQVDREMRDLLLLQSRMLGQAIPIELAKTLTGSTSDLSSPVYQRLKDQLISARQAIPLCRSVSLLGRNTDGSLFCFVDGQSPDSKEYSPPGQIYEEAPQGVHRAFATRSEGVDGPYKDRYGNWVSGLVPVMDSQTALSSLATTEDAKELVHQAHDFYLKKGKEAFLKEINDPHGEFCKGPDLYIFAYDKNMTWIAHPIKQELVGLNWIDKKDWNGGKYFRREIQQVALSSRGNGWVDYEYLNVLNGQRDLKTTYVERIEEMIVCSGAYRGDGKMLALLSMNVDAAAWNRSLVGAALPILFLILALAMILIIGSLLWEQRSRMGQDAPPWLRHLESLLAAIIGLVLTLFTAKMAYQQEVNNRSKVFNNLASERTRLIVETIRNIPLGQLEVFSRFYERSNFVADDEFRKFMADIGNNPSVQAWEWIPKVSAKDKTRFEEEVRASTGGEFEIWQKDAQGKRGAVTDRDFYYPVTQVTPLLLNSLAMGYDLGSESTRSKALEEACYSKLPTGTDPITLVQERSHQKGMLVFRPIFSRDDPSFLRGFTLVVLRMGTLLKRLGADQSVDMELSLYKKATPPELIAASWSADSPPDFSLCLKRPIFAYGKVFMVTVLARPGFLRLYHPVRAGVWGGGIGLLLTSGLVLLIHLLLRRSEELERLVFERTAELHLQVDALNAAANAIVITDNKGIIKWVNHAFTLFTGFTSAEAIGKTAALSKSGVHDLAFYENLWKTILAGEVWRGEIVNRRKEGLLYTEEMTITPIKNEQGRITHFIAVKQDVTEKKKVESELHQVEIDLRHAQKMESIGNLAAGMAHEINTPLQSMHSNVLFLDEAFSSLSEWHRQVSEIQKGNLPSACVTALNEVNEKADLNYFFTEIPVAVRQSNEAMERVTEIVSAMKEFSRPREVGATRIDLNLAINSTLTVCRSEWKSVAELVTCFEKNLPLVSCVASDINQVILNLVINAVHAIATSQSGLQNQEKPPIGIITVSTRQDGDWVEVKVSDTGSGMSDDVKSHIFDPFYTTKEVGKGTGLGLLIAYTIIEKKHGGKIGFESELGKGTTFFFRLPLTHFPVLPQASL